MGYTHYWTAKPVEQDDWDALVEGARRAAALSSVKIALESDEPKIGPYFGDNTIRFNGIGEEGGHETFLIEREGSGWDFCKTARKPYDVIVVAILAYAHAVLGWEVSSDGSSADWRSGIALAKQAWPEEAEALRHPKAAV